MLRKLKNLEGFTIHGRDKDLGKVKDFYFDQHRFVLRYIVADTGSWLKNEKTLISTEAFEKINYDAKEIIVDLSSAELEKAPGLEKNKPVSKVMEEKQAQEEEIESNLRSFNEVRGYHIQAEDKEFGHLEDIFVDEENWIIRYLLIDTRNILPGKNVLIAPEWLQHISWNQEKIFVSKTKEEIKNAPEYREEKSDYLVDRRYEEKLYNHYDEIKYWQQ